MVKSTHISFPREGVALHISAEDAIAYGINPGEPAVVEVTVRGHTIDEWIAEASASTFETEAEAEGEFSGAESGAPALTAEPVAAGAMEDHPRISWRSALKPVDSIAELKPVDSIADEAKPVGSAGSEEPTRITWRSARAG